LTALEQLCKLVFVHVVVEKEMAAWRQGSLWCKYAKNERAQGGSPQSRQEKRRVRKEEGEREEPGTQQCQSLNSEIGSQRATGGGKI
jgi:hypothetical protein